MTLQEAWYKILELDNFNELSPSQIFSILSDFGVFVVSPKLRIAIKTALNYGLWDLITESADNCKVSILKSKLENDGFTDSVINEITGFFRDSKSDKTNDNNLNQTVESERKSVKKALFSHDKIIDSIRRLAVGVTPLSLGSTSENNELNKKIIIIPSWNDVYNITFIELQFTDEKGKTFIDCFDWEKRFWLKYSISFQRNNFRPLNKYSLFDSFDIFIIIICNGGRIHSKNRVSSICIKDKFAISKGIFALDLDIPISEIENILLVPEIEESIYFPPKSNNEPPIEISSVGKSSKYGPLNCKIDFNLANNSNKSNVELLGFSVWGYEKSVAIAFIVRNYNNSISKLNSESRYSVGFFNQQNRLIDSVWFFVDKTGFIYFKYFDLEIEVETIDKIIISQSK